jgi:hypothetical protein
MGKQVNVVEVHDVGAQRLVLMARPVRNTSLAIVVYDDDLLASMLGQLGHRVPLLPLQRAQLNQPRQHRSSTLRDKGATGSFRSRRTTTRNKDTIQRAALGRELLREAQTISTHARTLHFGSLRKRLPATASLWRLAAIDIGFSGPVWSRC